MTEAAPEIELVVGQVYKIHSRNLRIGVWDGQGFIGIREKFGARFLFTEYPNTARALEPIHYEFDPRIKLWERYPSACVYCGWPTSFDKEQESRWQHLGGTGCANPAPVARNYHPLFEELESIEIEVFGEPDRL